MSTPEERANLAKQQAAVMRALLGRGAIPEGFVLQRIQLCARSLRSKRSQAVQRVWPTLAACLGEQLPERFAAFAAAAPPPAAGGPLADGRAFARTLANDEWTDAARLEVLGVDLRYRSCPAGLLPRRGPALRFAWLGQRRCLLIGLRLPWLGMRVVSVPVW